MAKAKIPGFKELDYQAEAIDGLLRQVLKAKVDPDVIPIDDGPLNSFVNGLINTSAACYMNVVFQALVRMPGIKDYFLQNDYKTQLEYCANRQVDSLAERFGDFVKTYYAFNGKVLEAEELKTFIARKDPRFDLRTQEDAHEFLLFLIEYMGRELNR
jgi:ubiquitin C-terminal hydrolase